jgi:hypothetical protein
MGDFCSQNRESITDTNFSNSYESATRTSSLPNSGTGFSNIGASGLVDQSAVDDHVVTLLSKANATTPGGTDPNNLNPASNFAKSSAALRSRLADEYCVYYKRYMFALQKVLLLAATSGMNLSGNADYISKKKVAQDLNSKLNQLLQVMQGLINIRTKDLSEYYGPDTGVNSLNTELDNARKSLVTHMGKLQSNDMEMDVKSSMIDYTLEKNSSSRNLLAIYGFMNIVAGGILFYLYTGSRSS